MNGKTRFRTMYNVWKLMFGWDMWAQNTLKGSNVFSWLWINKIHEIFSVFFIYLFFQDGMFFALVEQKSIGMNVWVWVQCTQTHLYVLVFICHAETKKMRREKTSEI